MDLGLGRAPGAGPELQRALRKNLAQASEYFPNDVVELRALLTGDVDLPIKATPGLGADVQMWMLGSSLFGAQLAAKLGMPYAFAAHFAPDHLDEALEVYRRQFQPSQHWPEPYVMVAMNVFAAESREEAEWIASSQQQAFVQLRTGKPGKLPPPVKDYTQSLPAPSRAMLAHVGQAGAVGTPGEVREAIESFIARTGADEILLCGSTFDPQARLNTLDLTLEALRAPVTA